MLGEGEGGRKIGGKEAHQGGGVLESGGAGLDPELDGLVAGPGGQGAVAEDGQAAHLRAGGGAEVR